MFGKLMSVSDELMWRYFELLSARDIAEIDAWRDEVAEGRNPRDVKFELALEMVERFHTPEAAREAKEAFIARFQRGALPDDLPLTEVSADASGALPIANLLKLAGLVKSTSEALRMIGQGAVRIDGERLEDAQRTIPSDSEHIYQVGKRRFARVTVCKRLGT